MPAAFLDQFSEPVRQLALFWGPIGLQMIGKLIYALLILYFGRWLSVRFQRMVCSILSKSLVDAALTNFVGSLVRYGILAAAICAALEKLDVKTASLLAVFASAGLAVGLALQGSLSNFAAGTMILFFRPFTTGDQVEAAGRKGVVDDIGIFTTRLLNEDNEVIIIPNSAVTGGTIVNYTVGGDRRATVTIDLKEEDDLAALTDLLSRVASENPFRDPNVAPVVSLPSLTSMTVRIATPAAEFEQALNHLRRSLFQALKTQRHPQ